MTQNDARQQDLEFRRQAFQRAVEQVRGIDVGDAAPTGVFSLERSDAAAVPTEGDRPPFATTVARPVAASAGPAETAAQLGARYRAGDLSPAEVTRKALERAHATQSTINAFITLLDEKALQAAQDSEQRFRRGEPLGPLDGVPVAIKDLIHMAGERTTCGSKIMADFVAAEDAPVVRRLRAGGAVIIGKTNLHEFAYGGTGDVSYFGPVRNPRNLEHITGGSSSGSAAAVAGGICPVTIGSDTACSIRTPAALCGIVGLKPTYGRVSTEGAIPLSWSQDHLGPMTATVEDAGLALSAIGDFVMPPLEADASQRLTIGVCRELFFERLDTEVRRLVERAIGLLGDVREVTIPHLAVAGAIQAVITSGEVRTFHRQWLEARPDDYDWVVRNRMDAAAGLLAADYVQATRARSLIVREMREALVGVDVLAMPSVATTAPRFGQREVQLEDGTMEVVAPLMLRNAAPMNVSGFPAISVPCGNASNGMPVGLQLVGLPWQEDRLLQVAHTFEARLASST